MSLLPSKPETSEPDDAEPRVIGVDSEDAEDVISALSSETARELLAELHEDPAPPSELSDRVDTSLQNTQYHLEKLEAAGAVSVVDTAYSAKGREMNVYAPADQPLVIFAGDEEKSTGLKAALSRLLGGVGLLALGSVVVQNLYGDAQEAGGAVAPSVGDGGNGGAPAGGNGGNGGAVAPAGTDSATTVAPDGGEQDVKETVPETTDEGVGLFSEPTTSGDGSNYTLESTDVTTNGSVEVTARATETTTPEPTTAPGTAIDTAMGATDAAAGLEPGLLFFLGGALILALWLGVWYAQQ